MTDLRTAAQQALEFVTNERWGTTPYMDVRVYEDAARIRDTLRAALATVPSDCPPDSHQPQEPWGTRERFYEAIDRAVKNVREDMRVKTVTMRLPEYDMRMPIIDAYSGHVLVGPGTAPPQRPPLTEEEIINIGKEARAVEGSHILPVTFARAIERAHGIGGSDE